MTQWLAGMKITANRLNDGVSPTAITSGLTAATNFTTTSFFGYKIGHLACIGAVITTTNSITQTSGNISDVAVATLPAGWAPLNIVNGVFGNGVMDGEYTISASGVITLRSALANIGAGTGMRLSTAYVFAT